MRIKQASVRNFRLLKDVHVTLDASTTVIVGRNNSGKTSFGEAIRRMVAKEQPQLSLHDFSVSERNQFLKAAQLAAEGASEQDVRELLPVIAVDLVFDYSDSPSSFGGLAPLVIDLDENVTEAHLSISFALPQGETGLFFLGIDPDAKPDQFFSMIDERVKKHYRRTTAAVNATDETTSLAIRPQDVDYALMVTNVRAQRGLDDITTTEAGVLGNVLEQLFHAAEGAGGATIREDIVGELENALGGIHKQIDATFNTHLEALAPVFELFGFPGTNGTLLKTESKLEFSQVLRNYTRVLYPQVDGPALNESYNGLGTRNLLHILLQVVAAFREWSNAREQPETHLVFIEKPEAFLHPQVQEVFIRQLSHLRKHLQQDTDATWPVQFVITTHSPHVANEVEFTALRYFRDSQTEGTGRVAVVKDLASAVQDVHNLDARFLHQYLTLTSSNLFFADAAILVEGTSERLTIPRIIGGRGTSSRASYVCILEVGGAYAYKFIPLLDFLGVKSLVVADIDSGRKNSNNRLETALVSQGTNTSNATLKNWFDKRVSPTQLLTLNDEFKIHRNIRVAYQVPELPDKACGRSFEEAFILANPELFALAKRPEYDATPLDDQDGSVETTASSSASIAALDPASQLQTSSTSGVVSQCETLEERVSAEAKRLKKSDFAIKFAVDEPEWLVPRYLLEGLDWLLPPEHSEHETETDTTPVEVSQDLIAEGPQGSNDY